MLVDKLVFIVEQAGLGLVELGLVEQGVLQVDVFVLVGYDAVGHVIALEHTGQRLVGLSRLFHIVVAIGNSHRCPETGQGRVGAPQAAIGVAHFIPQGGRSGLAGLDGHVAGLIEVAYCCRVPLLARSDDSRAEVDKVVFLWLGLEVGVLELMQVDGCLPRLIFHAIGVGKVDGCDCLQVVVAVAFGQAVGLGEVENCAFIVSKLGIDHAYVVEALAIHLVVAGFPSLLERTGVVAQRLRISALVGHGVAFLLERGTQAGVSSWSGKCGYHATARCGYNHEEALAACYHCGWSLHCDTNIGRIIYNAKAASVLRPVPAWLDAALPGVFFFLFLRNRKSLEAYCGASCARNFYICDRKPNHNFFL